MKNKLYHSGVIAMTKLILPACEDANRGNFIATLQFLAKDNDI